MRLPRPLVHFALVAAAVAAVSGPSSAFAQKKKVNVVELAEMTITGRVQKPVAAVDISRIAPKLSLSELRQPFLEKIEKVIYSDPF